MLDNCLFFKVLKVDSADTLCKAKKEKKKGKKKEKEKKYNRIQFNTQYHNTKYNTKNINVKIKKNKNNKKIEIHFIHTSSWAFKIIAFDTFPLSCCLVAVDLVKVLILACEYKFSIKIHIKKYIKITNKLTSHWEPGSKYVSHKILICRKTSGVIALWHVKQLIVVRFWRRGVGEAGMESEGRMERVREGWRELWKDGEWVREGWREWGRVESEERGGNEYSYLNCSTQRKKARSSTLFVVCRNVLKFASMVGLVRIVCKFWGAIIRSVRPYI
jgi:hypothetical protein